MDDIIREMGDLYAFLNEATLISCSDDNEALAVSVFLNDFGEVIAALPDSHPNGAELLLSANKWGRIVYWGIKSNSIEVLHPLKSEGVH